MFKALRALVTTLVAVLQSRTELAGLELAQLRSQLLRWFIWLLVGALFLLAAILVATFAFVAANWNDYGWRAALLPVVAYALIGLAIIWRVRNEADRATPPLARTSAELARDRDIIAGAFSPAKDRSEQRDGGTP